MEIKRININDVQPGLLVADNVYNTANQLLVPKDSVLTDKAIARMRFHSVMSIRVYVGENAPTPKQQASGDVSSYYDRLRETEEYQAFNACFRDSIAAYSFSFNQMLSGSEPNRGVLAEATQTLLNSCRTNIQLFDLIHCTRKYDDITFAHSINVALIAATMGNWLGYGKEDVQVLMECGIYHDIGKLMLPREVVEKTSALTPEEYALVKTHTARGYNLLKTKNLDTRIKLTAMTHHERCNGSGYPLSLRADKLEDFAKIVAIADVYEAMTSPRVYRKAICPFAVIRNFENEGLALYDPKFLMTFMENITQCYLGNRVKLNDGTVGTIVYINKFAYSRPMIQVDANTYIDLSKIPEKSIEAIL